VPVRVLLEYIGLQQLPSFNFGENEHCRLTKNQRWHRLGSGQRLAVPVATTSFTLRECFAHALTVGWEALDDSASNEILNFALSLG
jgi:hypothetical protein